MNAFFHPYADADSPQYQWNVSQGFGAEHSIGNHLAVDMNWSSGNADVGQNVYMPVDGEIKQVAYSASFGGPAGQNNGVLAWVNTADGAQFTLKWIHQDVDVGLGSIEAGDVIGQLIDISNLQQYFGLADPVTSHSDFAVMQGHWLNQWNSYTDTDIEAESYFNAQGLNAVDVITSNGQAVTYVDPEEWMSYYANFYTDLDASPSGLSSGGMSFAVDAGETITVGVVSAGAENVIIDVNSNEDVDLELWAGGEALVGYGIGALLGGSGEQSIVLNGIEITASGWGGDGSGPGKEFIEIDGIIPEDLTIKITGFEAGDGQVEWMADTVSAAPSQPSLPSPGSSSGGMSFAVDEDETITVGVVSAGAENVIIDVDSNEDVDLELWAGGEALVGYGIDALLGGSGEQSVVWNGIEITASGWGGDGSGPGEELIEIDGIIPEDLTIKITGFEAGDGQVEWMMF